MSKRGCTFSFRAAILRFCGVTGYISRLPSYNFLIIEELQVTYFDFQVTSYSFVMKSYDFFRPLGGGILVPLNDYFETPARFKLAEPAPATPVHSQPNAAQPDPAHASPAKSVPQPRTAQPSRDQPRSAQPSSAEQIQSIRIKPSHSYPANPQAH